MHVDDLDCMTFIGDLENNSFNETLPKYQAKGSLIYSYCQLTDR